MKIVCTKVSGIILGLILLLGNFLSFGVTTAIAGTGTSSDPYTVAQAILIQNNSTATVQGYIVGEPTAVSTVLSSNFPNDYALALADTPNETDLSKMLYVQLTTAFRANFGLMTNPSKMRREVIVSGTLTPYYIPHSGLKSPTYLSFDVIPPVTVNTYTANYDGNGNESGNLPVDSNSYLQGAIVTTKGNTGGLSRTGYTFTKWNTKADGTGTSYAVGDTFSMGASNITLYAMWTDTSTVWVDSTYNETSCDNHVWNITAFKNITDAVNGVVYGGTVNIKAGSYNENVIISTSGLTINASTETVLTNQSGTALKLNGSDIKLSGLSVNGGNIGIESDGSNITINEVNVIGCTNGVILSGSTDILKNSTITENITGNSFCFCRISDYESRNTC